jgi:hypothetical protein
MFQDRGHYYVEGILMEGMTMAQCREQGGLPSVTTILDHWQSPGLTFWKINENVEAAYRCIDSALRMDTSLDEWKKLVADEFYRVNNHLQVGTDVHDIMEKLIKNGVSLDQFSDFFHEYASFRIRNVPISIRQAYAWYLDNCKNAACEKIIYDKANRIAGTADVSGMVRDDKETLGVGGVDWKHRFIKQHPGYKKDGTMKALRYSKDEKHMMQVGAYGKVEKWMHAWVVVISTNPDVQGIKPMFYGFEELKKGYMAYAHISRTYDILNKFGGDR